MGCGTGPNTEVISVDPSKRNNLAIVLNDKSEAKESTGATVMTPSVIEGTYILI